MLGFVHLVDGHPSPHAAPIVGPVAVSAKGGWLLRRAAQRPVMARRSATLWWDFGEFCYFAALRCGLQSRGVRFWQNWGPVWWLQRTAVVVVWQRLRVEHRY